MHCVRLTLPLINDERQPCKRPATQIVVGPSGTANSLCKGHFNVLRKMWNDFSGFTVMSIFTLGEKPIPTTRLPLPTAWPEGSSL